MKQSPRYGGMGDVGFERQSGTSAAAAESLTPQTLSRLEAQVLAVILARARTCDAVEAETGLSHQTVSARIRALAQRGLIEDATWRARTRSGREAVVWRAVKRS